MLFRRYEPRLVAYFRAWAGDDAEDLAMDVWVAVASSLDRFEGDEADFRRWLFTIARHRLIDARRKRNRRRTDPVAGTGADRADGADTAVAAAGQVDAERLLALVIEHLTPVQAEVFVLRVVADLSAEDVGRVLGREPAAVRALQRRALQRLARKLGGVQ